MLEAILDEASRLIPIREGDRTTQISARNALIKAVFHKALKGDARAQTLAITSLQAADEVKAREIAEASDFWEQYQSVGRAKLAEAAERGVPPPKLLPHPDDIILDRRTGPSFVGPFDDEGVAKLERTLRLREVLIMQDALDEGSSVRLDGRPFTESGGALVLYYLTERCIPPRLRLSDHECIMKMEKYRSLLKRDLLKQLYQAWRDVGVPVLRGHVSPNRSVIVRKISLIFDLIKGFQADLVDIDRIETGDWNETTRKILEKHGYVV